MTDTSALRIAALRTNRGSGHQYRWGCYLHGKRWKNSSPCGGF